MKAPRNTFGDFLRVTVRTVIGAKPQIPRSLPMPTPTPTIVPFDNAVVVRPLVWKKSTGGIHLPGVNARNQAMEEKLIGKVIAVGPGSIMREALAAWFAARPEERPPLVPRNPMNVKTGDVIIYSRALFFRPQGFEGEELALCTGPDILAKISGLDQQQGQEQAASLASEASGAEPSGPPQPASPRLDVTG